MSDSCDLLACSPPGSSVHGISQARILEWVAISFARGSSWPRDWTYISCISCTVDGFFTTEPSRWECKLVEPLWKAVWRFLKKTDNRTAIWSNNLSPGIYLEKDIIQKHACTTIFTAALFTVDLKIKPCTCQRHSEGTNKTLYTPRPRERSSDSTRLWARPAFECLSVSCGGMGQQWPATRTEALAAAEQSWEVQHVS